LALKDWVKIRLALLNNELDGVYSAIRDRVSADTQVVVTTYPRLFDGWTVDVCGPANEFFDPTERYWADRLADTMAGVIWRQAPKSGFLIADTRVEFARRGSCSQTAAINGVLLGRDDEDFHDGGLAPKEAGSFHPNEDGVELYAQAVNRTLREAQESAISHAPAYQVQVSPAPDDGSRDTGSGGDWFAGVVEDPDAVLAAYPAGVVDSVRATTFVDLYADHKTTDEFDGTKCGAVVPGEAVPLSANGFATGSEVQVIASAITADTSTEIVSVTATADQGGVLRHDLVFPSETTDGHLLVEVQGVNSQGGFAYGNTFLEATTDAGCLSQARQAGAVPGFVPVARGNGVGTGGEPAGGSASGGDGSGVAALGTTGASNRPVVGWSLALVAAGSMLLWLRHGRRGLRRREGLHTRPTGQ
jgi:hypothetical protein